MQISDYTGASQNYYAIEPSKASPQGNAAGQDPPNAPAAVQTTDARTSLAQSATSNEFSVSMLIDLLNSKGHALQTPGPVLGLDGQFGIQTFSSSSVSSGGVPGGLQLDGLNASDAANEVIDRAGSNGELNLSNVDNALGINAPETGYTSPEAVTALEWARLAGSPGGTMTAAQLTNAIQSYLDAQGTMPPQTNAPMLEKIGQPFPA